MTAFQQAWPAWSQEMTVQDARLRAKTRTTLMTQRWEAFLGGGVVQRQRVHTRAVHLQWNRQLHATLGPTSSLMLKMPSGPEAGAFLRMREDEDSVPLPDAHLRVSLLRHLRAPLPAGGEGLCCHRGADGRECRCMAANDGGHHAVVCQLGGGVVQRHIAVRDALVGWMQSLKLPVAREQAVPRWHRDGEQAILDIVYRDARLGDACVDVSIVDAAYNGAPRSAPMALQRREVAKHRRYPGPGLVPFVMDTRGRWGREAVAWVQSVTSCLPDAESHEAVRQCRLQLGRVLQLTVTDQILEAVRPPPAGAHAATAAVARTRAPTLGAGSAATATPVPADSPPASRPRVQVTPTPATPSILEADGSPAQMEF